MRHTFLYAQVRPMFERERIKPMEELETDKYAHVQGIMNHFRIRGDPHEFYESVIEGEGEFAPRFFNEFGIYISFN